MSITGTTDLGSGMLAVTVDHDPTSVATDAPEGSLIVQEGTSDWVRKLDNGASTNVAGFGGAVAHLNDVGDVSAPAPASRDLLRFNDLSGDWESYQDNIPELKPHLVGVNYAPTWAQFSANGPVIIVDTTAGDVEVTLPAADTIPADGLLHRGWVHHIGGGNKCVVVVDGEDFHDGLAKMVIPEGVTTQLGGMYMGPSNEGWLRISKISTRLQIRRAATWAAINFAAPAAIPWDTEDIEDNDSVIEWEGVINPSRVTIKFGGYYDIKFFVNIDSTGGLTWNLAAWLEKNGTEVAGTRLRTGNYGDEDQSIALPGVEIELAENDYLEVVLDHTLLTGNLCSATMVIQVEV